MLRTELWHTFLTDTGENKMPSVRQTGQQLERQRHQTRAKQEQIQLTACGGQTHLRVKSENSDTRATHTITQRSKTAPIWRADDETRNTHRLTKFLHRACKHVTAANKHQKFVPAKATKFAALHNLQISQQKTTNHEQETKRHKRRFDKERTQHQNHRHLKKQSPSNTINTSVSNDRPKTNTGQ